MKINITIDNPELNKNNAINKVELAINHIQHIIHKELYSNYPTNTTQHETNKKELAKQIHKLTQNYKKEKQCTKQLTIIN